MLVLKLKTAQTWLWRHYRPDIRLASLEIHSWFENANLTKSDVIVELGKFVEL